MPEETREGTRIVNCCVCGLPIAHPQPAGLKGEFAHVRCGDPAAAEEWPETIDAAGEEGD